MVAGILVGFLFVKGRDQFDRGLAKELTVCMDNMLFFQVHDILGAGQFKALVLLRITNMPVAPGTDAFFLRDKLQMDRNLKCLPEA